MYQALYRKWRPRTFDEVVGQSHITDILKRQVAADRLSHAYLFTGTRGTGKTTCAKILARAVNCEHPVDGNPCNACPACLGIENGSILDVLELDAASNNGVDQVRALRDEAVYSPAAVRRRVYIVDEVHMLSTAAFNALLKILEEPPAHLMFILATTELHKVPATIRSRCQQYAFKRILPGEIAGRLEQVARAEGIPLTADGAALLARLADGGLRDALSLLDQCTGGGGTVDEAAILSALGLAGNLETAALMGRVAAGDTAGALEKLGSLYAAGKDVGTLLGELSALARDLLIRKTAPQGGASLLTGGYDEAAMRALSSQFTPQRLVYLLTLLQDCQAALARSTSRRTDAELCLIRMCDAGLDDSPAALAARVARLESLLSGTPVPPAPAPAPEAPAAVPSAPSAQPEAAPPPTDEDAPPWDPEEPEAPTQVSPPAAGKAAPAACPAVPGRETGRTDEAARQAPAADAGFWRDFVAAVKPSVPAGQYPFLSNPAMVTGIYENGVLTLWAQSDFVRNMLNQPAVLQPLEQAAGVRFGQPVRVKVTVGQPPAAPAAPRTEDSGAPDHDNLDDLLAFGEQFDNIIIQ